MGDDSDLERTEEPTARRLEKAREEGQIAARIQWLWMAGFSQIRMILGIE